MENPEIENRGSKSLAENCSASSVGRSKTLAECGGEFSDAWRKLCLTVAYEMKLDKICDWLAKILRRFNG